MKLRDAINILIANEDDGKKWYSDLLKTTKYDLTDKHINELKEIFSDVDKGSKYIRLEVFDRIIKIGASSAKSKPQVKDEGINELADLILEKTLEIDILQEGLKDMRNNLKTLIEAKPQLVASKGFQTQSGVNVAYIPPSTKYRRDVKAFDGEVTQMIGQEKFEELDDKTKKEVPYASSLRIQKKGNKV